MDMISVRRVTVEEARRVSQQMGAIVHWCPSGDLWHDYALVNESFVRPEDRR